MNSCLLGSSLGLGRDCALQGFFFLLWVEDGKYFMWYFSCLLHDEDFFSVPSNNFDGMGNVLWRYGQTIPAIPVLVGILACWATRKNRGVGLVIWRWPSRKPEDVALSGRAVNLESFFCRALGCPEWWNIWGQSLWLLAGGFCRLFVCIWEDY